MVSMCGSALGLYLGRKCGRFRCNPDLDRNRNRDRYPHHYTHEYSYPAGNRHVHGLADTFDHEHADQHPHPDVYDIGHLDRNALAYAHGDGHAYVFNHTDLFQHTHCYGHQYIQYHGNRHGYSYDNLNPDSNGDMDTHLGFAHTYVYLDARVIGSHSDAHADPDDRTRPACAWRCGAGGDSTKCRTSGVQSTRFCRRLVGSVAACGGANLHAIRAVG